MPRPSIKHERREDILKAYERCIALYGLEGATQKRIAEEAGIARPLLRHHVGNNEELLREVVKRYTDRCRTSMQELAAYPFSGEDELLALLFLDNSDMTSPTDTMIATNLIVIAQTHDYTKELMTSWFDDVQLSFEKVLSALYQNAKKDMISIIASGLIGIYFNHDALFPIKKNDKDFQQRSYQAAKQLLLSLQTQGEV
ncbi:TetR/AcrR family transcriptional regulator [Kiloniella sp. EL199]|uniref:TetR/AcrR family transcriptional regulator n=1 Tax=Kiloniella sp. EL199 TaxID=2107581 RepID=UPI000EA2CE56|nr:TetR/AcrR family transcriptional regulator [Kiloniella sp. EL199]